MSAEKKCAPNATRLQSIEGVLFDCDGVLTPGDLFFDERGGRLLRFVLHGPMRPQARTGHGAAAGGERDEEPREMHGVHVGS